LADIERHEAKRKAEEERLTREELSNGNHKMDGFRTSALEVVDDEFDDDIDQDMMMLDAQ
jgi:DNA excision repair protein ERCC-2